jgi:uncharacterized protein
MFQNVKESSHLKKNMQKFEERIPVIFENEGQKIFGVFHQPLNQQKPVPAVLMCHGFAGNKIGKYRIYISIAQKLAQMGIATLRFDFRGSGESEGEFSDLTIEGEVSDALKGLEFLQNNSQVDPKRIGILGNSFGGAIAVKAAKKSGQAKSLVLLAPLFNSLIWRQKWEALMGSTSSDEVSRKELSRLLDGNVPGPGFYGSFFKLNLEPDLQSLNEIPLLHIQSEKDDRVGTDQFDHYQRCRENSKGETRWIRLQKCDHDFSNAEERAMLVEETAQWFAKTL